MKEDTKATRETKAREELMELMDARENLVILVFLAVKGLRGQTVYKEIKDQKETLALTGRKEKRVILEMMVHLDVLEIMAHWDHREIVASLDKAETKVNVVMMVILDQMVLAEIKVKLERKGSKVLVETEVQEENRVTQDPLESEEERAQLAPMEPLATLANRVLLVTEVTRVPLDQRDLKGREESKELQETEARWGSGETMVLLEMVL